MNTTLSRAVLVVLLVCALCACQKEINSGTDPQDPAAPDCLVTEMSNLNWSFDAEDSTDFSKFEYDNLKRLTSVAKPSGDTDRFIYYTDSVIQHTYITFDFGNGLETIHWKEKYRLNANGLTTYKLTYLEDVGGYLQDSAVYTYDGNGYLTAWRNYSSSPNYDASMQFDYKDGNLVKLAVTSRGDPSLYNALDSVVIKYSNLDVPADYSMQAFWPVFQPAQQFPWTGKQNKKLPTQVLTYYRWGADTDDYSYVTGADGLPSIIRQHTKEIAFNNPGTVDEWRQAYYLRYRCN